MANYFKSLLGALILTMVFTVNLEARNYYGAISYSPSTGAYGYSYDHYSKYNAERAARNQCARRDCVIPIWFKNACGALAIGSNGYGSGWGSTRARAKREALRSCRRYTGGCYIEKSVCTTR